MTGQPEALPLTVQQLAGKYNAHAEQYYRKAGRVPREAGLIAEALLIACARFVGYHVPQMADLSLADAVNAAKSLFKAIGVPRQVVVHH